MTSIYSSKISKKRHASNGTNHRLDLHANMCAANRLMACTEHHLVWHHGDAENARKMRVSFLNTFQDTNMCIFCTFGMFVMSALSFACLALNTFFQKQP